jgi:23S rRNA (guanine2445-N2)-methyltransferase / 23S rRNA (guanine2069-N7)-methyltransferase
VSTRWFAPCAKGLEYLLRDELLALGAASARESLAGVYFEGDAAFGYRACLWSRLASRVLMPIAEFEAETSDALYQGARAVEWERHLDPQGSLAIDAHGTTSGLTNSQFAAVRVKDAIVDHCRERFGARPDVDRASPDLRVNLVLRRGRATLSIDFAGAPLLMRGYRQAQGEAPLKENLAAAMLLRARWPEVHAAGARWSIPCAGRHLDDRGGLDGRGRRAGARSASVSDSWGGAGFDRPAWEALRDEARAARRARTRGAPPGVLRQRLQRVAAGCRRGQRRGGRRCERPCTSVTARSRRWSRLRDSPTDCSSRTRRMASAG